MTTSTAFQRFFLPGFAFKAVVIGGGYATGRELAEFFLPNGPHGALLGMGLSALIWSLVCAATFAFAYTTSAYDYRSFFQRLLGPGWFLFECGYLCLLLLMLSIFAAAAGAIFAGVTGGPAIAGTLILMIGIAATATFGNVGVEGLFKWASFFLYGVYAIFVALCLWRFGDSIGATFSKPDVGIGWAIDGLSYAGYNVVGCAAILPVVRHMTSRRDAVIAGLLCGPLAMAPAALFLISMVSFYPVILSTELPSEFLLQKLGLPFFSLLFQFMILAALLESGAGGINAINERIAGVFENRGRETPPRLRLAVAIAILLTATVVADQIGLVELIAKGYRGLAFLFLAIYVVPVLTYGLWSMTRPPAAAGEVA